MHRTQPAPAAILLTTACLLLPPAAWAGSTATITPVVVEGDSVAGVGLVTSIDNLAVNNDGSWLIEADTNNADTDADSVLLRNGTLALREGGALAAPAGSSIDSFDSVTLNDLGQSGFNFFLDGTTGGNDDSSIHAYLDTSMTPATATVLVVQESDDAPNLPPGAPLIGFFDVKINNAGELLTTASLDDPIVASTVDRGLYLWTSNASTGGIVTSSLLAEEGDVLPGQAVGLTDFGTDPHETALNDTGEVLFAVDIPSGDAIYLYDGSLSEIAQEGDPSPIAGRNWTTLNSTALDLNASGGHVYRGGLDGDAATNTLIVCNGQKLVQEGDTLPAIGGVFTFTSFGTGPLAISDSGDVLWYGDWNDPDTTVDAGLFLNDELLVQEGVTTIGALGTVETVRGIVDGYQMSNDGRYILFEAVLTSGLEGAFLIHLAGIFADGFESGDTSAWTSVVP